MGFLKDAFDRVVAAIVPPKPVLAAGWEVIELPLPVRAKPGDRRNRPYFDVLRTSPAGDVWLMGTVYAPERGQYRIGLHDTGSGFVRVDAMPSSARWVWPLTPTDAWFAGNGGSLAHYDGDAFTRHVFPKFYYDFLDVFARDGGDVWMVAGDQRVVRFDGTEFHLEAPAVLLGANASRIWGSERDLMILVNARDVPTSVARFDGTRWEREAIGTGGATLIHGSGPNDIWVLSRGSKVAWHYDGAAWSAHEMTEGLWWAVHVAGPDRAYAAGDDGQLATWDGTRWTTVKIGAERLTCVCAQRDGRVLVGGAQLYRSIR